MIVTVLASLTSARTLHAYLWPLRLPSTLEEAQKSCSTESQELYCPPSASHTKKDRQYSSSKKGEQRFNAA